MINDEAMLAKYSLTGWGLPHWIRKPLRRNLMVGHAATHHWPRNHFCKTWDLRVVKMHMGGLGVLKSVASCFTISLLTMCNTRS